jgi:hypothetical protein
VAEYTMAKYAATAAPADEGTLAKLKFHDA